MSVGVTSSEVKLSLAPCSRDEANAFVEQHHRHHGRVAGHIFALACVASVDEPGGRVELVVGVAIVGRPVARGLQDGLTAEVTRVATDGTRNACSFLYGASWRAARSLGYRKLVTYTLAAEGGASLRAAGWRVVGEVRAESWSRPSRPRVDKTPLQKKLRWEATP
jgi:hypothetical protein